jgi:UDP-glucose 4-epimerase
MKILVTGGAGFIGSHIVEHYQHCAEVVVLDNFRTGRIHNLKGLKCQVVEGSILDRELLDSIMPGVDYVFHLAALVSVPESMECIHETVKINVSGLLNVLESARTCRVKKLIFASSAAVYGEGPEQPKQECMLPAPRSPYAVTKLDGEYYCDLYHTEGWLSTASVRFFNVFGPRQDPASQYAAAVPIFIESALHDRPITIFGDGGQTRDFIYVKDIVEALAFLAEDSTQHGVFNAGYGKSVSILDLVESIRAALGSDSPLRFVEERAGDLRHSTSDPSRLLQAGWQPSYSVNSGIEALLARLPSS